MTAEIAILNTHGVAIAADSATTVRLNKNEYKIFNSANKVFTLSKYQPVGIMIYNNAGYMGIEWEIIIKEYRRFLKKRVFKTLFEYANDFIKFISNFKYIDSKQQKDFLMSICYGFYSYLRDRFLLVLNEKYGNTNNLTDKQVNTVFNDTIDWLTEVHKKINSKMNVKVDLNFIEQFKDDISITIKKIFEKYKITNNQIDQLFVLLKNEIQKRIGNAGIYTGIVITGFGKDEIFPSIYNCHIHGKLGKYLMISNEQKEQISQDSSAYIIPFAQSEMVNSFMKGIDPEFEKEIVKQIISLINSVKTVIDDSYKDKLKIIQEKFFEYIENIKQTNYINPVMKVVNSLQKTELAEMAESLVNLTSFKKHISNDSETVGGPIDVAVITKGDGFIWIKRKHYFDIKLNNHFFTNYYEEE